MINIIEKKKKEDSEIIGILGEYYIISDLSKMILSYTLPVFNIDIDIQSDLVKVRRTLGPESYCSDGDILSYTKTLLLNVSYSSKKFKTIVEDKAADTLVSFYRSYDNTQIMNENEVIIISYDNPEYSIYYNANRGNGICMYEFLRLIQNSHESVEWKYKRGDIMGFRGFGYLDGVPVIEPIRTNMLEN